MSKDKLGDQNEKGKIIEDLDFKIPLKISIQTIVEMGSLSAAIDSGILEDGYWTDDNEIERTEYLEKIHENVTKHLLEELKIHNINIYNEK